MGLFDVKRQRAPVSLILDPPAFPSVKRNSQAVDGDRQADNNERPRSELRAYAAGSLCSRPLPLLLPVQWERLGPSERRGEEKRQEETLLLCAVGQPEGRPAQQQTQHGDLPPGPHQLLGPQSSCTHPGTRKKTLAHFLHEVPSSVFSSQIEKLFLLYSTTSTNLLSALKIQFQCLLYAYMFDIYKQKQNMLKTIHIYYINSVQFTDEW